MPSTNAPGILRDFADAVDADDPDAASTALEELETEYEAVSDDETVRVSRALSARDHVGDLSLDVKDQMDDYANTHVGIEQLRASVLMSGAVYLADPTKVDASSVSDDARTLADEEESFVDVAAETDDGLADVSLPASLAVVDVAESEGGVPKGDPFSVSASVINTGGEPASNVVLSASATTGVEPDSTSTDTLAPDEELAQTFTVEADSTGEVGLELEGDADDVEGATRDVTVVVRDKRGLTEFVEGSLEELHERIDDSDAITGGTERSLLAKVEAAQGSVDRALSFVDEGRAQQANNQLGTGINQLGALLNELDAGSDGNGTNKSNGNGNRRGNGGGIPPALRRGLEGQTEGAIDSLTLARRADI